MLGGSLKNKIRANFVTVKITRSIWLIFLLEEYLAEFVSLHFELGSYPGRSVELVRLALKVNDDRIPDF